MAMPDTARRDPVQERGAATYWIVDPDAQVVEVWHPDLIPERLRRGRAARGLAPPEHVRRRRRTTPTTRTVGSARASRR